MRLEFTGLRAEPERLGDVIDVVANLEADFRLVVDGDLIYEEVSFPVAELAVALSRWSQVPIGDRPDFEFDSMSAEESGILWIRRSHRGWRVGSIHQDRPAMRALGDGEVDGLVHRFVHDVGQAVRDRYGRAVEETLKTALHAPA